MNAPVTRVRLEPIRGNQKGVVLVMVMSFVMLMIVSVLALSTMVQRDVGLIRKSKEKQQLRFIAEAGLNHALAKLKDEGFAARSDFSGNLDTGAYDVTFSEVGGRYLIISVGTIPGISDTVTVTAEIADNTPTALNYFSGAENNIKINSLVANATIIGDIHANNNVYLKAGPILAWLYVIGKVSATGIVKEGTRYNQGSWDWWDNHVVINGDADDTAVVYEGQDRITFPTFDYEAYRQAAIASGNYYSGNQTIKDVTITPGNGIVYVDGNLKVKGSCTVNGGVIADEISILGTLNQRKRLNRNVIIAKNGDIRVFGRLYTEEALVFAAQDIKALQIFASLEINGTMMAKRDIKMWNLLTYITYNYVRVSPDDMLGVEGEDTFKLISWNQ